MELKNVAVKRKKPVMSTHTKLPMSDATNLKTPMPTLERAQVVIPATPLTTRVPTMKRGRVLTPTQDSDIKEFLEEIKARQSNKEELLDYVLGLISTSPDAKQMMVAGQSLSQPFVVEENRVDFEQSE